MARDVEPRMVKQRCLPFRAYQRDTLLLSVRFARFNKVTPLSLNSALAQRTLRSFWRAVWRGAAKRGAARTTALTGSLRLKRYAKRSRYLVDNRSISAV
jgi:predicted secreted protein